MHCTAGTLTCYLCACLLYLLLLWFSGTARSWKSENWPWQIYVAENARWLRPYVHKWCNALLLKMRCVGRQGQNPLNSLMATFSEHWKMGCYPRKKKEVYCKMFFWKKKKKKIQWACCLQIFKGTVEYQKNHVPQALPCWALYQSSPGHTRNLQCVGSVARKWLMVSLQHKTWL